MVHFGKCVMTCIMDRKLIMFIQISDISDGGFSLALLLLSYSTISAKWEEDAYLEKTNT